MTVDMIDNGPRPVPPNVPIPNYCAFMDVLGYTSLVLDPKRSYSNKSAVLNSLYSNLVANVSIAVNDRNRFWSDQIYIKSGSDSIYLECARLEPLIIAVNWIFVWTFGFYDSFALEENRTPLLRCGIVKDWSHKFMDIASATTNAHGSNPVGPGPARAYLTSEFSHLSGMRVIIAPEVMADIGTQPTDSNPFPHMKMGIVENGFSIPFFFKPVYKNELGLVTNLHELVWTREGLNDCSFGFVEELEKLLPTFTKRTMRHFAATARIMLDGLPLTDCRNHSPDAMDRTSGRLEKLIQQHDPFLGFRGTIRQYLMRLQAFVTTLKV